MVLSVVLKSASLVSWAPVVKSMELKSASVMLWAAVLLSMVLKSASGRIYRKQRTSLGCGDAFYRTRRFPSSIAYSRKMKCKKDLARRENNYKMLFYIDHLQIHEL